MIFYVNEHNNVFPFCVVTMENLAAIILISQNIFIVSAAAFVFYVLVMWTKVHSGIVYIGDLIWNSLTPGHQFIELLSIITSIITFVATFYFFNEIFKHLDYSFTKLKQMNQDKDQTIADLEAQIRNLTKTK